MNYYPIFGKNYRAFRVVVLFIYAIDKIFTRPPVAAVAPNINSGIIRPEILRTYLLPQQSGILQPLVSYELWQIEDYLFCSKFLVPCSVVSGWDKVAMLQGFKPAWARLT